MSKKQVIITERHLKPAKKRVVTGRLSSDSCRSCKDRKVKCDGERPVCRKCRLSGRECGGYAIWEVQLNDKEQTEQCAVLPAWMSESAANRVQLVSNFLSQQYPSFRLAAPDAAHGSNMSFLHSLAVSEVFSPMLRSAVETIGLAHLANIGAISSLPQQESYGRTLSLLRAAIADTNPKTSSSNRGDVIATSVALSLLPTRKASPYRTTVQFDPQPGLHLVGASVNLEEHGPSALSGGAELKKGLLFNIHFHSLCRAFARRKRAAWNEPQWRAMGQIKTTPAAQFPAVAKCYPLGEFETEFVWCSVNPRESMVEHLNPLPGLLERSDNFVEVEMNASARKMLEYEFEDLAQRLNSIHNHTSEPVEDSGMLQKLMMINVCDIDMFNPLVEEHVFMQTDSTFPEFYQFADSAHGGTKTFWHIHRLLGDCALLQVMYNAAAAKGMALSSTNVRLADVERRAYWHASELCRCAFFWTSRSLSGARYLHGVLRCALNFFASYGAVREMEWCRGCAMATRRRIDRLEPLYPATLCRLEDVMETLPDGFHYDRVWLTQIRSGSAPAVM